MVEVSARFCLSCGADLEQQRKRLIEAKQEEEQVGSWTASIEKQNAIGFAQNASVATYWTDASFDQTYNGIVRTLNWLYVASRTFQIKSNDMQKDYLLFEGQAFLIRKATIQVYIRRRVYSDRRDIVIHCYLDGMSLAEKKLGIQILSSIEPLLEKNLKLNRLA